MSSKWGYCPHFDLAHLANCSAKTSHTQPPISPRHTHRFLAEANKNPKSTKVSELAENSEIDKEIQHDSCTCRNAISPADLALTDNCLYVVADLADLQYLHINSGNCRRSSMSSDELPSPPMRKRGTVGRVREEADAAPARRAVLAGLRAVARRVEPALEDAVRVLAAVASCRRHP